MNKYSLVSLLCLVGAVSAAACGSSNDTSPEPTAGAAGKGGAGAGGSMGGKGGSAGSSGKGGSSGSAGASVEAGAGGEGGTVAEPTLYERLGEHPGIRAKIDAIVAEEVKDPIIGSYFSQQASSAHKPTVTDIKECFTNLLGNAAGGPELYPFKTTSGFTCRAMTAAHATLGIGAGTFDKFVGIAATVLTDLEVAPADVATVGAVLNGTKTAIVDPNVPSGAAACKSPASCSVPVTGDGGAGGDSGTAGAAGAQ